jgi:hypothetical protein
MWNSAIAEEIATLQYEKEQMYVQLFFPPSFNPTLTHAFFYFCMCMSLPQLSSKKRRKKVVLFMALPPV